MATEVETEECYECLGAGEMCGTSFGDYGWHACYKCLTTGRLPTGTRDAEYAGYAEECCRRNCGEESYQGSGGDRGQYDGDWEGVPAAVVAPHGDSDLPF